MNSGVKFWQASAILAWASMLVLLWPQSTAAQDLPSMWVVPKKGFECLLENRDVYLASQNDPILIYVTRCPETDINKIFSDSQQNSLPNIQPDSDPNFEWHEAIVLKKEELRCLDPETVQVRGEFVAFATGACP